MNLCTDPTCRHCGGPLDQFLGRIGTHVLCEPDPVRRHRICEWLWGVPSDGYLMPVCATGEHRRNPHRHQPHHRKEAMAS